MNTGLKLILGAAAFCVVGSMPGHAADLTGSVVKPIIFTTSIVCIPSTFVTCGGGFSPPSVTPPGDKDCKPGDRGHKGHKGDKGKGYGKALAKEGIARALAQGFRLVVLVGDMPYYGRFGFVPVPRGQIALPGPVDPARLLALELAPGALGNAAGLVQAKAV